MVSACFDQTVREGHALFTAGRFFEAHEAWEGGWRITEGAEKRILQSLALWAAGFHHQHRGNPTGAVRLMARALEKLSFEGEHEAPFELESLKQALHESLRRLKDAPAGARSPPAAWDPDALEQVSGEGGLEEGLCCPYCGEPVSVTVDPELSAGASYVEDCPVCCHPWSVEVRDEEGRPGVELRRSDD